MLVSYIQGKLGMRPLVRKGDAWSRCVELGKKNALHSLEHKRRTMRFISQADGHSCGPIAIMNLKKWMGLQVRAKNLTKYKRALATTKWGTHPVDVTLYLDECSEFGFEANSSLHLESRETYGDVLTESFDAAIVLFGRNKSKGRVREAHYCLVLPTSEKKSIEVVNFWPGEPTRQTMSINTFVQKTYRQGTFSSLGIDVPWIWTVTDRKRVI